MLVSQGADTWPADYAKGWITLTGTRIPLPAATDGLALARAAGAYYAALAQHGAGPGAGGSGRHGCGECRRGR